VIEITLLGIPILVHAVIGIRFALEAKMNSSASDGTKPSLGQYGRNRAYSWQRITSYFLLFMLIFHIGKFRFYEYPKQIDLGQESHYLVQVTFDSGLYTVASRLGASLYDQEARNQKLQRLSTEQEADDLKIAKQHFDQSMNGFDSKAAMIASESQFNSMELKYRQCLQSFDLTEKGALIADCPDFGTASILSVRDTFKNKIYASLYTLFVCTAVFHGCNGFWTFCITWGVVFKKAAQMALVSVSVAMMAVLTFLGLAAIWGTYFITLKS
jgi:succinate dehydrogenase / fumarate reductase cytochrome b subunit